MTNRLGLLVLFLLNVGSLNAAESTIVAQATNGDSGVDPRRQMEQQYQRPQHQGGSTGKQKGFQMICPQHAAVEMQLSHTQQGWNIAPKKIKPDTFERAYGQVDKDNPNKVTQACLYRMNVIFTAIGPEGSQQCPTDAEGKKSTVNYSLLGLEDYKTNISGSSVPGTLEVINTGQHVDKKNHKLICEYKTLGSAQLFKAHTSDKKLSSCRGNSLIVDCN